MAGPAVTATAPGRGRQRLPQPARSLLLSLLQLGLLLWTISTLLFFLLRLTGDPAAVIGGEGADPETLAAIRRSYGLDQPLIVQYGHFLFNAARLDLGSSVISGQDALGLVLERIPATLQLAGLAIVVNMLVSVPLGTWIGANAERLPQAVASGLVFVGQGLPGYVVGLLLIQLFAVQLRWLPSIGNTGTLSWLLPSVTLASFMVPRLVRVLASNVAEAMHDDYVRTARADGASERTVLFRHVLPNALLGATALVGGQLAFLFSGAVITEVIFAWPGLGLLLIDSVRQLDFPVVQASVLVVTALVFVANAATDRLFAVIDPRLRRQRA